MVLEIHPLDSIEQQSAVCKTIHRIQWKVKVVEQVLDKDVTEKEKALDKETEAAAAESEEDNE